MRPSLVSTRITARALVSRRWASTTSKPARKIGAFQGGFVGFLTGASLTGFSAYYYLIDKYRVANTVVVGDVVALNGAVQRLEAHVKALESRLEKK